ncbi:hypothetical protein BEN30_03295 [Magnetovibrio blakemorei]|uniref:DUF2238 domain-containing protein n=2 Tax=Magnetovibrio blakemorei TaxID=28181 RepID=A0A1E5QB17_9PROT|nr:hypothetical protein BEN30_03295 [Magnetovibrio blakemorei]
MNALSYRFELSLLALVAAVMAWSVTGPHDMATWWMEAVPVVFVAPVLILTHGRFPLTPLSYGLIAVHALILLIGAHYTYALVPAGQWLQDAFDLSRNHYDRLGHFVQGFVPAIIARELLIRTSPLCPGKWLFALVVLSCLGISAAYELIEWLAGELSADGASAFLGTQGDEWDTQKDMALAAIGAIVGCLSLGRWQDRQIAQLGLKAQAPDEPG